MGQGNVLVDGSIFKNAAWLGDIVEERILDSLEAKILKIVLYEKLRRLISLKSSKELGDGILGIRVRR